MINDPSNFKWNILDGEQDRAMVQHGKSCEPGPNTTWHGDIIDYIKETYNKETFRTCIDAGASYGFLSVPFSYMFEKVHCFEPHPNVFSCLKKNTEPYQNIHIYPQGLSDKNSVDTLVCTNKGSGTSILSATPNTQLDQEIFDVEIRTLDSYNIKDVDFIKIDVEGSERELILGAAETIRKYRPVVYCEIHSLRDNKDYRRRRTILEFFESLNYKLHDIRFIDYLFLPS